MRTEILKQINEKVSQYIEASFEEDWIDLAEEIWEKTFPGKDYESAEVEFIYHLTRKRIDQVVDYVYNGYEHDDELTSTIYDEPQVNPELDKLYFYISAQAVAKMDEGEFTDMWDAVESALKDNGLGNQHAEYIMVNYIYN